MDFDWIEYLKLAKELSEDSTLRSAPEAKLRSAISRAYYSAFHKVRAAVLPAGRVGFGSHQEIIDILQESDDAARRQLGVELARLKSNRKKADYDNVVRNIPALVEDTLIGALQLVEALDSR